MNGTLGLVIGRFQPFHRGHEWIVRKALDHCDRLLIILGSAEMARSVRNPWTVQEREALIRQSLPDVPAERLCFAGVPDVFYREAVWLAWVERAVEQHADGQHPKLFGHTKDSSSYYLALFPQWDYYELPNHEGLSATPLREALLTAGPEKIDAVLEQWQDKLASGGQAPLQALLAEPSFAQCHEEFLHINQWRRAWAASPYDPVFVTADALVECEHQVLLVQRGRWPGKGLWALPGGFVDQDERVAAAAWRELHEETGLDLSAYEHQWVASHVYDAPERSDRGRVISHLQHYKLHDSAPKLKAADDAANAQWWAWSDIRRDMMFDDHYCILQHALDRYG